MWVPAVDFTPMWVPAVDFNHTYSRNSPLPLPLSEVFLLFVLFHHVDPISFCSKVRTSFFKIYTYVTVHKRFFDFTGC